MSKQSFLGHLCSNRNSFSRTAGAGRTYSKLLFWESQFSEIIYNSYEQYKPQNDRLELPYVVKKHNFACCGRTARAKRISPMECSYGSQDGSNELSHAQFHARASEIARTKYLLLYRFPIEV